MAYRIAKCLDVLRAQVKKKWPNRATSRDGWIGDAAHSARPSDHNPDSRGIVHALDLTHDPANGFDSWKFADMLLKRQDKRMKYVISNGRIGSGPAGPEPGKWRKYTGKDDHSHHVHVSAMVAGEDDSYDWVFDNVVVKPVPDAEPTLKRELAYGMSGDDVKALQTALGLAPNGYFGYGTAAAVVKVQQDNSLAAHGVVGPGTWKVINASK